MNNLKKSDTWKIQFTIAKNFISSIDNDEGHVMHLKSENMETMINNDEDLKVDIKKKLELLQGSEFAFNTMSIYCIINVIK